MSDVETFINNLQTGKVANSNNAFKDIMASKVEAALNHRKIEIANNVYNGAMDNIEQETADVDIQSDSTESE
jgi:hypothetical protein